MAGGPSLRQGRAPRKLALVILLCANVLLCQLFCKIPAGCAPLETEGPASEAGGRGELSLVAQALVPVLQGPVAPGTLGAQGSLGVK